MFTIPSFQNSGFQPDRGFANGASTKPRINQPNPHGFGQNRPSNDVKQKHFELFNALLQKAYEHLAENTRPPQSTIANGGKAELAGYAPVDKITAEQAAGNILDFIGKNLQSGLADGVGKEKLLARLEQSLQGFEKGFNEAKDTIESLGLLTPELAGEIDETYQRVTDGLSQFRDRIEQRYATDEENTSPASSENSVSKSRVQIDAAQSASFSLELVTQEGDKVTIDIAKSSQFSYSAGLKQTDEGSVYRFSQKQSTSSAFQLTVEGDLNESELAAIDQVLQEVDDIAGDFYQGNLDEAFASAQALDINREQLASLDLELQKTTVSRALASYSSVSQQPASASAIADLNQLVSDVEQAVNELQNFSSPLSVFEQIVQGVGILQGSQESSDKGTQFADLIHGLISQFEILPVERPAED